MAASCRMKNAVINTPERHLHLMFHVLNSGMRMHASRFGNVRTSLF